MNFNFISAEARAAGEPWIHPVFEGEVDRAELLGLDEGLRKLLRQAAGRDGFTGKRDQSFTFHTHQKVSADRIVLVGLGERGKYRPEGLRLAMGACVKRIPARIPEATVSLPTDVDLAEATRATVEGLMLGRYRFLRYKAGDEASQLARVRLWLPPGVRKDASLENAAELGRRVADATNWARERVDEPGGAMTPSRLASEATALARANGLSSKVVGRKEIEKLKMGLFLGVAQGSVQEPKLIHLGYTPKTQRGAKRPMVALVGKAITFDSGGLSLKTSDGMLDMKSDMGGAAAVLGAMGVIAHLAPPFPVHAFIGTCENMPSGSAYRPGDVLISRSGKTVEVTNTDAEGRLTLGDVLYWASEQQPAAIIDLATLTGACMIALGQHVIGAFGDDDALMDEVLSAGMSAGEALWRLPIHELQKDALRSDVADLKNAGEKWGGAINAAVFLRNFVGEVPWVHLDIAGPSFAHAERGYLGKGATGAGLRTLVDFIRNRAALAHG